jgi:hypothetical protein
MFSSYVIIELGTTVFGLSKDSEEIMESDIQQVLSKYPSVSYYKCKFISKDDDIHTWYK